MRRMKINGKKIFISVIVCGLMVLFLGSITTSKSADSRIEQHNCRFWGMVFQGELGTMWEQKIQTHLEKLKRLSDKNDDGWGIGYYILSSDPHAPQEPLLPVISRGEPKALNDETRYDNVVDELIAYVKRGSIAHVRKCTNGPMGLPDPHPFRRKALYRNFDMLFAHNGTIDIDVLVDLIGWQYMAPDSNPPDYMDAPNPNGYPNMDSDLYAIYIMKVIDHNDAPITNCIVIAVNDLVEALQQSPHKKQALNFVMTDGFTLWALRYAMVTPGDYTLYYYPNNVDTEKWIAASVEMDNDPGWVSLANYTLVVLRPGKRPEKIDLSP